MEDFASAVLMRAVRTSLARDGIPVEGFPADGALMPLADKRRLLAAIAEAHGLRPLLRVGQALPELAADPAVLALVRARDPQDLLFRWSRLERFAHSRHRVVRRAASANGVTLEHVGLPGRPPEPFEDAVVLGVLAGLMRAVGVDGLAIRLGGSGAFVLTGGRFTEPEGGVGPHWEFTWRAVGRAADPVPAMPAGAAPSVHAKRLLGLDLQRRWRVDDLAAAFGRSPRSLQRDLAAEGGFSALLARARAERAAELLVESPAEVSAIGFACGYADQPHFTRDFKRRTAMTPAAYRTAFARENAGAKGEADAA